MQQSQCRAWHAWLDTMPPGPHQLHVIGDVLVPNPGVVPQLTMKEPQGINPAILLLDLHLVQQPGIWPQMVTCKQVRFDRVLPPGAPNYTSVDVFENGKPIAEMKVEIIA